MDIWYYDIVLNIISVIIMIVKRGWIVRTELIVKMGWIIKTRRIEVLINKSITHSEFPSFNALSSHTVFQSPTVSFLISMHSVHTKSPNHPQ